MKLEKTPFACTRDGLTIRGFLLRAPGTKPLPGAVVSHEFLENHRSVEKYARALAEAGFAAFVYDFCGGCILGKSDGKTQDMTVLTELGDLFAVMDHVLARPDVLNGPLFLLGCSQGGFVSAMAAARRPRDVRRLALFYPALSIPDDARKGRMIVYRFDPENVPETLGRVPIALGREYALTAQGLDAYEAIRGYGGPVLLLHGTSDRIVDIDYSLRAAKQYGEQCRFVKIPGAGHIFRFAHAKTAARHLTEFACAAD